jgi:hypothetical protein
MTMSARTRCYLGVAVAIAVAGCGDDGRVPGTDGGGGRCTTDDDCNDMTECTIDSCGVGGSCEFTAIHERCMDGETCVSGRGCQAGMACDDSADCDDMIACTVDSCGVGGTCRHMPIHERCTDPAMPMCDPVMGCTRGTGCTGDPDCMDEHACTLDTCGADMTCRHMPINERCMPGELCSPSMGCYTPMPCTTADECQDDSFCNGAEVCMPEFGCAPAETPRMCNDSDACTRDSCDPAMDMCVFACDPSLGASCMAMCPPPAAGCNGRFSLSGGTTMFGCPGIAPGIFPPCTAVDFSEATFELADGVLSITALSYMTTSDGITPVTMPLILTDSVEPTCPMFDATIVIGGACAEHYRIYGMFTGDDTFTATLEWRWVRDPGGSGDSCMTCGCVDGSSTVMGTRIP